MHHLVGHDRRVPAPERRVDARVARSEVIEVLVPVGPVVAPEGADATDVGGGRVDEHGVDAVGAIEVPGLQRVDHGAEAIDTFVGDHHLPDRRHAALIVDEAQATVAAGFHGAVLEDLIHLTSPGLE